MRLISEKIKGNMVVYLLLPVLQKFDAAQWLVRQKVLGFQGLGDLPMALELPCWLA